MTVGVVYSLLKFVGGGRISKQNAKETIHDDSILDIGNRNRQLLLASVGGGLGALALWLFADSGFTMFSLVMLAAVLVMAMLMVPLGAILSLQIGSSASPVSGTVFVTTLVLCVAALATNHKSIDDGPRSRSSLWQRVLR